MKTYYVLFCHECTRDGPTLPLPFDTPRERAQWWTAHKEGTGHTRMLIVDQLVEHLDDFI